MTIKEKETSDFGKSLKYIFGSVHRPNTEFRIKIQYYIDTFRTSTHPTFHSNQTCMFAHIRKDDRVLPHIDMTEWCSNHTVRRIIHKLMSCMENWIISLQVPRKI